MYQTATDYRSTLIAAGLRAPVADRLLANTGRDLGRVTVAELIAAGAPAKTAAKVAAAISLGSRACESPSRDLIGQAEAVWRQLRGRVTGLMQEVFYVLAIDVRNNLLDVVEVARGTLTGVEVHPREVFRAAIRLGAAGIVLAHNHPSGDATPSAEDIALTRRLREAGALLGIPVLDHVVVTASDYRSIAEWMGDAL